MTTVDNVEAFLKYELACRECYIKDHAVDAKQLAIEAAQRRVKKSEKVVDSDYWKVIDLFGHYHKRKIRAPFPIPGTAILDQTKRQEERERVDKIDQTKKKKAPELTHHSAAKTPCFEFA